MRKPKRVEAQRGLQRLQEEIEAFARARGTLPRINAFTRVAKRLRAVAARATGVTFSSEQPEKDICFVLEWVVNGTLWMEMWLAERTLLAGTKPAQTRDIVRKFPMYLQEMRRAYPRLVNITVEREAGSQASAELYASVARYTEPRDPGRRGPRIDLNIQQIDETSIDGDERSLSLSTRGIEPSDAKKLREALMALPCVNAVQMNGVGGCWRREVKYSVRATLTTEDLAKVLTNGLRGMVFTIITLNARTVEISKR